MTVATLAVNLTANAAEFHKQMERAARRTEQFGRQLSRAGREITHAISLPIIAAGLAAFKVALDESHRSFGPLFTAFEQLKARLRETFVTIGVQLTPVFLQLIALAQRVATWIQALVRAFDALPPGLQQAVILSLLFLAALGPTLIMVGKLVTAIGAIPKVLTLVTSGTGLTILAIVALAAAGLYVATHWDEVKLRMVLVWTAIKEAVFDAVSGTLGALGFLTSAIPGLGTAIAHLKAKFDAFADSSLARSAARIAALDAAVGHGGSAVQTFGGVTNDVKAVVDQYNESVRQLGQQAVALGPNFNMSAAMAQIFEQRLMGMIRTGNLSVEALQALGAEFLQAQREGEAFAATLQAVMGSMEAGLEAVGTRIGEIFAGMHRGFRGFAAQMVQLLVGVIKQIGQTLVHMGVAALAAGKLGVAIKFFAKNPYLAIAAGAALIALGSALAASSQRAMEGGFGGEGGGGGGGGTAAEASAPAAAEAAPLHLHIHGDFWPGDPRFVDILAQGLSEALDRGVTITPEPA